MSDTYDVYGCQLSDREVKELSPENLVVVVNKETIFMEKNFVGKLLVDTPAVEVRLLNFRVGQQTPYEMAEYDLSLFVTEGTGNLALGYEDIELTKSTVVVVPKGMLWGIKNSGNGNMTILQNINKNPCLC